MSVNLQSQREIDDKIVELVNWARQRYGIKEGCPPETACDKVGLKLRFGDIGKRDGLLSEKRDAIVVSSRSTWQSRVTFTIFHEIVHYLLEEEGDEIFELYTEALRNQGDAFDDAIEQCCNAGAAEFLLPRRALLEAIASRGFSIDLVEHLTRAYGSSLLATVVQLAHYAPIPCYIVVCTYGTSPRHPYPQCLYIEQAARRADMRYPWGRGTPIPPDHLLRRVWDSGEPQSGVSEITWSSGKSMACVHAEARMVGSRVLGVFYLSRPPHKGQLGLF